VRHRHVLGRASNLSGETKNKLEGLTRLLSIHRMLRRVEEKCSGADSDADC
jgi:hypothetical protein